MRTWQRQIRCMLTACGGALVFACAVLIAYGQTPQFSPDGRNGNYKIAGVVVSEASREPLARARVTIVDTKSPLNRQSVITAQGGHFEFNHLRAGKYTLQGARRGFVATWYKQHQRIFSTAIVTGPSLDTANLILRLVPMATINGKILDETGEPVRKAIVKLYRKNHTFGITEISPSGVSSSDDRGYYEFWRVIPGTYYISASAIPWYAVHPASVGSAGKGESAPQVDASLDVSYLPTFYLDTTEPDAATPITIKGGEHVPIDLHLWPVPSLHLLLHVPVSSENRSWQPTLEKRTFDSVDYMPVGNFTLTADGTYELSGVPMSSYTVRLHNPEPGGADKIMEMRITQDGQELDASSGEPMGRLALSVKIPGQDKLPQQLVVGLLDSHGQPEPYQTVNQNGEAHFENLAAGKYTLVASSREEPYSVLRTVSYDTETPGASLDLPPGASVSMTAFLVAGKARIEGVVKSSGKPVAGVMVVLVPAEPQPQIALFRRDQTDFDGSFALPGVIPGSYTVVAIEDGWSLDWSVPDVLARYTPRGQKITVAPQEQGTIRLPAPVEAQPR